MRLFSVCVCTANKLREKRRKTGKVTHTWARCVTWLYMQGRKIEKKINLFLIKVFLVIYRRMTHIWAILLLTSLALAGSSYKHVAVSQICRCKTSGLQLHEMMILLP